MDNETKEKLIPILEEGIHSFEKSEYDNASL
jgi:hypothetical protein